MGSVSRRAFMLRMNTVLGFITVLYVDIVTLLLFLFRDSVGLSPTAPPPPKKKKNTMAHGSNHKVSNFRQP